MPVLVFFSFSSVSGQIYFEGLYGGPTSGNGVWTNGTVTNENGYLTLSYRFLNGQSHPFIFQVDNQGSFIDSVAFLQPDSVYRLSLNILAVDDSTYLGLTSRRYLTQPSEIRGDFCLINFKDDGTVYWERYFGDSLRKEIPQQVIRTVGGGYAMVGQAVNGVSPNDEGQVILFKTDNQGNELWSQEYGGSLYEGCSNLVQTPDQGFLLLGWTRSFGAGQRDFYLVKTDSLGNQEWFETYGGAGNEGGLSILGLSNGNYLLTGGLMVPLPGVTFMR